MRPALTGPGNDHAIVFIHGLGGSPHSTWGPLLNLLGGDPAFDHATLDCYAYPTSIWALPRMFFAPPPGLKEIVEGLQTFLHDRFAGFKRVDLVAHSLGGIVARACVIAELQAGALLPLRKLALIAVPNTGSSLAAVGQQVSFRHVQLRTLARGSTELVATNEAWRTEAVPELIDVQYILGGQDRCVSRESGCNDPAARPMMLINANHRNIVSPTDRNDSRYTILTRFLLSGKSPRSRPLRSADPLFEIYKPEHEPYYVERDFDLGLATAISAGHIWICGTSGVGKTAALRRAVDRNRWQMSPINLSSYADASPLGMICALADELALLATGRPAHLAERGFEAACRSIRASLGALCANDTRAVIVEEIPLGENALPEFLDYLSRLLHAISSEKYVTDRLVFAFSSIVDLSMAGSTISAKTRECFQILPDPNWSIDDLRKLTLMLADELARPFSAKDVEQICLAAKGRPRFVKQLFRQYRNRTSQGDALDALIRRLQDEQL